MAVTPETYRALEQATLHLDGMVADEIAALAQAWGRAWDEIVGALQDAVDELIDQAADGEWPTRSAILQATRVQRALEVAEQAMTRIATQAGVRVSGALPELVAAAGQWESIVAGTQLPGRGVAISFARVDAAAINHIVDRTTQQITSRMVPMSREATAAMRRELVRGVAVGENPRAAARRMMARTRNAFDGGYHRAERIARTEMIDAHRAGALASRKANADVMDGWMWVCDMSERTCPACIAMDGTEWPNSHPGPEGHVNCRCTSVPVTKSWAELGFEGLDEPAPETDDAKAWFADQPETVQRDIMGDRRYEAWKSGEMGWDDMAVKKENPDWRPSWQVAPVP